MAESKDKVLGDMDPEEFRRYGYRVVDWIADYLKNAERYPVLPSVSPGEIRKRLPAAPPAQGESMETILRDFQEILLPGITHWNHPGFFSYFAITGSGPGILGEMLSAALNVNAMLWITSPAATELEEVVLDWLRQMLGLPVEFWGIIYDTASISTLHALAAARHQAGPEGSGERLRVYASEQAHSSVDKAARTLGLGREAVVKVPVDEAYRMDPESLAQHLERDVEKGWTPFCVVATVGTTSTTSVDPVPQVAELCRARGLWLHVDAAYAGCAAILPEMRHILDGCSQADSLVVNPHKWLFTPIDLSAFYCRRPQVLRETFSLVPEYLKTSADETARNYMDYGVQLGRRFRALKLWMVVRYFGWEGLAARIRQHIEWARQVAAWIDEHPDFERMAPVPFSTLCFRFVPGGGKSVLEEELDRLNQRLLEAVNRTGKVFLSHTRLKGKYVLRWAIGNLRSQPRHVEGAWRILRQEAARLVT